MKKLVATMLALITLLCIVPTVAFAAETLNTAYGVFSYEGSRFSKNGVTLEIYFGGKQVFYREIKKVQSAFSTPSFEAANGYFIEKVEVNNSNIWGSASSVYSPTPKSKEYSGVLTLSSNATIKLYNQHTTSFTPRDITQSEAHT